MLLRLVYITKWGTNSFTIERENIIMISGSNFIFPSLPILVLSTFLYRLFLSQWLNSFWFNRPPPRHLSFNITSSVVRLINHSLLHAYFSFPFLLACTMSPLWWSYITFQTLIIIYIYMRCESHRVRRIRPFICF